MYSNFKQQAIEYVKQAVEEDKYEKNPEIKEAISAKFTEYLRRAEEINTVLQASGAGPATLTKGNDAAGLNSDKKDCCPAGSSSDPVKSMVKEAALRGPSFFREQAMEYVKQAVQADNARNYAKAFSLYMNALEDFKIYLKYETNPKMKEAVNAKFDEYLHRAEVVRTILDEDGAGPGASSGGAPEKPN